MTLIAYLDKFGERDERIFDVYIFLVLILEFWALWIPIKFLNSI